jgi:hypothetical protein
MTTLEQNLLLGAFSIIVAGIGWLIKIQSSTNKSLEEAVNQFKTAIAIIGIENKNQRENCIVHAASTKERRQFIDSEIHNIKEDTSELIKDVIIIKKDIIDIRDDVKVIKEDVVNIKKDVVDIKTLPLNIKNNKLKK